MRRVAAGIIASCSVQLGRVHGALHDVLAAVATGSPYAGEMQQAGREDLPRFLEPMLATTGPAPSTAAWAMEVKWDGIRAQLRFDGHTVCVRSRPGRDCTAEFPELAAIAEQLASARMILDGELVCFGTDGKPDFAALRARLGPQRARAAIAARVRSPYLIVFDVLHLDGRAVRELPDARRRELLTELALDGPAWRAPRYFVGGGEALLAATAEQGLEGVVAKRLDAPYAEGRRSRAWVKHKHRRRERICENNNGGRWETRVGSAGSDRC
jgi:bifunctional non-homologous end joining protein LigD